MGIFNSKSKCREIKVRIDQALMKSVDKKIKASGGSRQWVVEGLLRGYAEGVIDVSSPNPIAYPTDTSKEAE